MRRYLLTLIALTFFPTQKILAVPVVPNFQSGSMTSHTETSTTVTEIINSIDYRTGWEYSATGTNVKSDSGNLLPPTITTTTTVDGASSQWSSLDIDNMPTFSVANPDQSWQFTHTIQQPGMVNQTIIERTTEATSITDTISTFSQ